MLKRFPPVAWLALTVFLAPCALAAQVPTAASEDTKTRPNQQEITGLMLQVGRLTGPQQNSNIDKVLAAQADSKTPRSDFLFCTGLAYLGDARAQACVAAAYEKGTGVVEDWLEAYTWYAIACDTRIADAAGQQKIEEARDQLKLRLLSTYPHPTEEELDNQVNAQKSKISQYQEEIKKSGK